MYLLSIYLSIIYHVSNSIHLPIYLPIYLSIYHHLSTTIYLPLPIYHNLSTVPLSLPPIIYHYLSVYLCLCVCPPLPSTYLYNLNQMPLTNQWYATQPTHTFKLSRTTEGYIKWPQKSKALLQMIWMQSGNFERVDPETSMIWGSG